MASARDELPDYGSFSQNIEDEFGERLIKKKNNSVDLKAGVLNRALAPDERKQLSLLFPRINPDNVVVTGDVDDAYNCLAWALGFTDRWIWPWHTMPPSKNNFNRLFARYGHPAAAHGKIAGFGISVDRMTHGSLCHKRWESKCGGWLRIAHELGEMEGGTFYGDVQCFYQAAVTKDLHANIKSILKQVEPTGALADEELVAVRKAAKKVKGDIREEFEAKYSSWRKTWSHPLILLSSSPGDRTKSLQFLELTHMGRAILPLLIEKASEPGNFFALQVIDYLIRPEAKVQFSLDDPSVFLGEQARAVHTIRRWLSLV